MTAIPLGVSSFNRSLAKTPEILLKNMIIEKDPTNLVDGFVRYGRPGLVEFNTVLSSPVRGMFCESGCLGGAVLSVRGGRVDIFASGSDTPVQATGTITPNFGPVIIASGIDRALIATGADCYSTDGTTVVPVVMPGSLPVSSVAFINGYFILTVTDTQRFYWIAPGGTDPDALDFASVETLPDNIARAIVLNDELWFFGSGKSTEVFQGTADPDAPFQKIGGRLYNRGTANGNTVAALDNSIFWIGDDGNAYKAGDGPQIISDLGMSDVISKAPREDLSAWTFPYQGHTFYCVNVGSIGTWLYDAGNGSWSQWITHELDIWRVINGCVRSEDGTILGGDYDTGTIWRLSKDVYKDDDEPIVREMVGGVAILGTPQPCHSLSLHCATWFVDDASLDHLHEPLLEMRRSDDGGFQWSSWRTVSMGHIGDFSKPVLRFRRLGLMKEPGRIFHFRMSENALWRVSYARLNETFPDHAGSIP